MSQFTAPPLHSLPTGLPQRTRRTPRSAVRAALLATCLGVTAVDAEAQGLQDLSFGTDDTFDVLTWNVEWFPKSGQTTIQSVTQIIEALDVDVLAIQEVTDTDDFQDMVDSMPGYEAFYESSFFAGLAYIYKTSAVEIVDIYEIYTTQPFWSPFPRSPVVMELTFQDESFVVINNHFKCCGDGFLDLSDSGDEETRRLTASNLLKSYIDVNFPNERVVMLGDLNDLLTDSPSNNVFQGFLDDSANYQFADMDIATGSAANWSFPNWPSHLDHILITNELFEAFASPEAAVETIRIDDFLPGGFAQYDAEISDHRPVALRLPVETCSNKQIATQTVRFGNPANPLAFFPGVTTAPTIGSFWDPVITHAAFMPDATLDFVAIGTAATNVSLPTFGTLLCLPPFLGGLIASPAGTPFAIPIPDSCPLVGLPLCAQGISTNAAGDILLANAIDITLGG